MATLQRRRFSPYVEQLEDRMTPTGLCLPTLPTDAVVGLVGTALNTASQIPCNLPTVQAASGLSAYAGANLNSCLADAGVKLSATNFAALQAGNHQAALAAAFAANVNANASVCDLVGVGLKLNATGAAKASIA